MAIFDILILSYKQYFNYYGMLYITFRLLEDEKK